MKKRTKETQLELLPFRVGANDYAIDVLQVREIRPSAQIAPMAVDHPRIRGAIDVRGVQVPVVDLRDGVAERAPIGDAMVIVVAVARRLIGIVVDAVCDIVVAPVDAHVLIVRDIAGLIAARMSQPPSMFTGEPACR